MKIMSKEASNISHATEKRKNEHIEICLNQDVNEKGITTGFERYRYSHQALPEVDFSEIDISTSFLGKRIQAPYLISSMTGGTTKSWNINKQLAEIAEEKGWAMGLGSLRAAIENPDLAYSFQMRKIAPTIPLLANLGAVQLNYGYDIDHCRRAVDLIAADGLVLHLNSMQEVFQPGGNTNFNNLLCKIEKICNKIEVPVGVKEVGWGISGDTASKLVEVGVHFIDVAGAGGTSWIQVEKLRTSDEILKKAAETFNDWGIPTADSIIDVKKQNLNCPLIGSGGIVNGLESAKAISLGADLAGVGKALLRAASGSQDELRSLFNLLEMELKVTMYGIGAKNIKALQSTEHLTFIK